MSNNLSKHQSDLESLVTRGHQLIIAMQFNEYKVDTSRQIMELYGTKAEEFIKNLPTFKYEYQAWYTEAKIVVRQIIPDRLSDFLQQYDRPNRKSLLVHNYTIDDYLNRLTCWEFVVVTLGITRMEQQLEILRSAQQRFRSSLFDIRQSITLELFDREIDAARDLLGRKFFRAAGAVAGVVFEKHLSQICQNHDIEVPKRSTTGDLNELLKGAGVIEISQFRANQFLVELCALCVLDKAKEPTAEQVLDLIDGVARVLKTAL